MGHSSIIQYADCLPRVAHDKAAVDFRVEMGRSYASSCMYSLPLTVELEPTATVGQ